ncbi:CpsD/CapB family tyrosine-protein kinase [Neobacillus sp. YIM B02564]|uniref:non-specific protein-tyrosine kinase n=1 Tax=Neobacillus paridis TaxID=2803862 RepID=A0ABS1TTT6_9BACI|nr:CpsD/CapB family tyrosine-protein kinase [Neobacillus paridis]MBL4954454.1 CpsD/CapB family tyrosine-protein kinase [Neobacillus paridis]
MFRKFKKKDKRRVHLIAHYNPTASVTEQYRLIRNNLQFSSVDKEIKSVAITSPEASDGKSTTAVNLAIVLAQLGKQVLVIDTDLRKPTFHYSFSISNLDGLTSVLTKKIDLKQAISHTIIPNLDVLTSGPTPPNPSELLDSKAMENIMMELKNTYDYIVYDTPPLLVVTDAQIMANKCDGVVMVVSSGKTKKDGALKAKQLLEKANSNILGVVVNGVESKRKNSYGHYS